MCQKLKKNHFLGVILKKMLKCDNLIERPFWVITEISNDEQIHHFLKNALLLNINVLTNNGANEDYTSEKIVQYRFF